MHLWIKPPHLRLKERRTAMQRDFYRKQGIKKPLSEVKLIVMLLITVKCTRLDRKEIGWFCGKFSSGKSFLSRQARVVWQLVVWLLLPGCCLDFWDCRSKNGSMDPSWCCWSSFKIFIYQHTTGHQALHKDTPPTTVQRVNTVRFTSY